VYNKIVIGLHVGHDRSVSIVKDGKLIGHLAEERVDRIKHSPSTQLPLNSMYKLLKYLDINLVDVCYFAISYAFVNIENVIELLKEELMLELNRDDIIVDGMSHHLAHAYSTFYTSPFKKSMIIVADGAGDIIDNKIEAESVYIADENGIKLVEQRLQDIPSSYAERKTFYKFPYMIPLDYDKQISIARKYEQITYLLGFKWGQSGKTMGLAPYGKNIIELNKKFVKDTNIDLTMDDVLREIDLIIRNENSSYLIFVNNNKKHIAKSIQDLLETIVIEYINNLYEIYKIENLSLAGGLFLNCVLNHKILKNTKIQNIHIVPASGDDGQSIGAAFYLYKKYFGHIENKERVSPFLGLSYSNNFILDRLNNYRIQYKFLHDNELIKEIIMMLEKGFIFGLLRGRSEMGPRALGHRSILASPKNYYTREHLNRYVKHREIFRPFAPIVTDDEQFEYFDLELESPYMLFTANVKAQYRDKLEAIKHIDGSARVEAISKKNDSFLFDLLKEYKKVSSFPILLNTSFNLAGEPIVESPDDAIKTFLKSNIDFLVLENYILKKDYCEEI